jgi:hypothetical protein
VPDTYQGAIGTLIKNAADDEPWMRPGDASNLLKIDAKRGCNQGAITPRITLGAKSGNPRRYFSSNYL